MYKTMKWLCFLFLILVVFLTACSGPTQSYKARIAEAEADGAKGLFLSSYAQSPHSLDTYKKRLAEAEADKAINSPTSYMYAQSPHSLKTYKKRLAEAVAEGWTDDSPGLSMAAMYARSPHSLETYKKRLAEAKEAGFSAFVFVASSPHSLETYKKRLAEAEADEALKEVAHYYAASKHSLQ